MLVSAGLSETGEGGAQKGQTGASVSSAQFVLKVLRSFFIAFLRLQKFGILEI